MKTKYSTDPRLNTAVIQWLCFIALLFSAALLHAQSANFTAAPPFVATNVGKPNVVIALDISGSMKAVAYADTSAGNWRRGLHDDFNPAYSYYGYFESDRKYSYAPSTDKQFFYEDGGGLWDGNFLNWLTMRRMDVVRKVLVGGKVRDRAGESIGGNTWFILEGQNEPLDYTFRKSYSNSAAFSPIGNDKEVLISEGAFSTTTGGGTSIVELSDKVEVGQLSIDRDISDASGDWHTVTFKNAYSTPPSVVATALSYNGSHQSLVRVKDVTLTDFKVRVDEWNYLDGNHTTEDVVFVVAAIGNHKISITDKDTGISSSYLVAAGTTTVSATTPRNSSFNSIGMGAFFPSQPVLFTGTTSFNDAMPVTTRVKNISTSSFEVAMQEERSQASNSHASELVSWIAIERAAGYSAYAGVAIEIDNTNNTFTEAWQDVSLTSDLFNDTPMVAINIQTTNGGDPVVARYGNGGVSKDGFDVIMEEEDSTGAGDLTHPAAEAIGYLAVEASTGYKIRLGLQAEPTGILQQNSASIRFGMAVYNYDHSRAPTSIYNGNSVHGGTFRACYPDTSKTVASRTNFDICLDTHVKSPLSNIVDVIEDHPLIWGTTPIAETLYDIKGYFAQHDFNRGTGNHTQWYNNGTEGTSGQRNSYEISDEWDPYYYSEFSTRLPCAKSFVLHFNDGAPYKDFDGSGHPTVANDGVGSFGREQVLDDLALELRQHDCRTDAGMTGHQDIISYYLYAALGEGEAFNDDSRRMREAAANGGFIDQNGDHLPTPSHPSNFNDYVVNGAGSCTPNEWDENGDCNPDTFYFASDAEELVNQLNAALESITARSGSGGASSVIAASRSGEGAVFNAIFRPSVTSQGDEVTWIGDVHALMIDDAGNLRHDDGDRILEDSDKYIDMCSYSDNETKEVRIKLSPTLASRPTAADFSTCASSKFDLDLFDLEYLWSGATWLANMTDAQAAETQRLYTSTLPGRYILTGIDTNGDRLVTSTEVTDFMPSTFDSSKAGLIANTEADAQNIVEYIRGKDIAGYRSRQLNGKTMRLGDIIYSTPTVAGRPAENLDLIYGSESYRKFFDQYRYRRQMVYAGGNDGMLHAFNSGWYNPETKEFTNAKGGGAAGSSINYELGAELWAYAPFNGLAHLEYLTRPSYGAVSSDHLYFVDLEPRIFDAKIFANDPDHPGGWGTVLVVGSRLGGGATTVDADLGAGVASRTLRSSYTIIDITNPDKAPKVLLEYSHPDLGFTSAMPTPIVTGTDSEGNGNWYLMLGSGADTNAAGFDEVKSTQNAKLFLLNLKSIVAGSTTVLETSFGSGGILTLNDNNSFISDLSSVDYGLDKFTTDAVYFGTVSGDNSAWAGKLYRMVIQESTGSTQKTVSTWTPAVMLDPGRPITAAVSMGTDNLQNRWIHVGTGRFFTQEDNLDNSVNYYYGLKESRTSTGAFSYNVASKVVDITATQVYAADAKLSSPPTLTPALDADATLTTLEKRMKQYSDTSSYVDGWQRTLLAGERNFGAATLFGGTLTYTTFDPVFDECAVDGDARLYILNGLTGTAGSPGIISQDENAIFNEYVIDLGSSPATSPSLHTGDGYESDNKANAIIQTSDGAITTVEETNQDTVRSGEVSWRQIQ